MGYGKKKTGEKRTGKENSTKSDRIKNKILVSRGFLCVTDHWTGGRHTMRKNQMHSYKADFVKVSHFIFLLCILCPFRIARKKENAS